MLSKGLHPLSPLPWWFLFPFACLCSPLAIASCYQLLPFLLIEFMLLDACKLPGMPLNVDSNLGHNGISFLLCLMQAMWSAMPFFAHLMGLTSTLFDRMVSQLLIVLAATIDEMLIFCKVFNARQLVKMVNCSQVYMYSLSFVQANTIAAISRLHMLYLVCASVNPVEPHEIIFTFPSLEVWMNTYPTPFFDASVKTREFSAGSNGFSGMLSDIACFTSSKHFWWSTVVSLFRKF